MGDLAVSTIKRRMERRYTNSRMIHGPTSRADGDEQGTQGWYRQAKETKRGEMDGKESQCPIVVLKRGNGPPGPRGAKGVPRCGRGVGTTPRIPCLTSVSPRNHPVVWGTAIPQCDEPGAFNVHARKCEARNSSRHISSTHLPSAYNRVFGTSPVGRVVPRPSPEGSTRRVIMPRPRTTAVPPRARSVESVPWLRASFG